MTQNSLSGSTEKVLHRILKRVIYKRADGFRKDPNHLQRIGKLTSEERMAHVDDYLRERDNQNWRDLIQRLLSYSDGVNIDEVVDAGSGPGLSAEGILDRFNPDRIILVDATPEMLDVAKQRFESRQEPYNCEIEYINGQVEGLHTLITEPVDLVVMHWVIPYTKWRKQKQMLKGIREKTLRDGGMLLFDVPYEDSRVPNIETAIVQALAVHIGTEYGIPKLYRLGVDPIPTSSLTENVEEALSKAGFRNRLKKMDVMSHSDDSFNRDPHFYPEVSSFVSDFFDDLKDPRHRRLIPPPVFVPYEDYRRLKGNMHNIVSAICETLSSQKVYRFSTVVYVATK